MKYDGEGNLITDKLQSMLEKFCTYKTAKIAIKHGVIGLGQMGGKIADLFASLVDNDEREYYNTIAINSYAGDLAPLKHIHRDRRLQLEGGEGCGRKPELCAELLRNPNNQTKIIEYIDKYISDSAMYIVTAGLGGGTGTGLIVPVIKAIHHHINSKLVADKRKQKTIGAIVTIPKVSEPLMEKRNAVKCLEELKELLNKGVLRYLIIVDNEKSFREFRELRSKDQTTFDNWMEYSNHMVVSSFHELNIGICYPGEKNFDPRDLKNIFEDYPGCISLSKLAVPAKDLEQPSDILSKINDCLHNRNVLANGFEFRNARSAGFLLVKPKSSNLNKDLLDDIDEKLYEEMPETITRPSTYIDWRGIETKYIIYTIAKVTEFPERARKGIQEELAGITSSMSERLKTEKIQTEAFVFDDNIFTGGNTEHVFEDPFAETSPEKPSNDEEDYSILFKT